MKVNFRKIIAGTILVSVIGVTGYHLNKEIAENRFKRVVTEDGSYDLENFISYGNLTEYSLCDVMTVTDDNKLYIAKTMRRTSDEGETYYSYAKDIFTNKDILEGEYTELISESPIVDYLVAYDMIKAKYSESDILDLLKKIENDYEQGIFRKIKKEQV